MGGALPAVDAALVAASGARRAGPPTATDDDRALAARAATDPEAFAQRLGGEGERVLVALGGLSPRYQEALSLRFMCGLSPGEAAAALGCSRGTLAVVVHRALGALRRELGHQPGDVATPRGTPE